MVSVVVPTTIPRYSTFPGIGGAIFGAAVGLAESARVDRGHAQESETSLVKCDMFRNLTCEMHWALLELEHDDIRCLQTGYPSERSLCSYAYPAHAWLPIRIRPAFGDDFYRPRAPLRGTSADRLSTRRNLTNP